jgi:hypothetical protein
LTLVHCLVAATLVGPKKWLPDEPFDYGWNAIGCNQLRCMSCGQWVQSRLEEARFCRHYECACQARDEYSYHVIGSDAGTEREFRTAWYCAGHPLLPLPSKLDGIEIGAVAPWSAIVRQTLATPPFLAPGFRTPSFWVQRLYRLLPSASQQAAVGLAVASLLSSTDPPTARAAMDFFIDIPGAPGAEQIAGVAERERDRLRAVPDPGSKTGDSLYDRMLAAIDARLVIVIDGAPVDQAALEVARRALLAGEADSGMMFRVAPIDATWYCEHAAAIVRARPDDIEFALEALTSVPAEGRALALQNVRSLGKAAGLAVNRWVKEHRELFDRAR